MVIKELFAVLGLEVEEAAFDKADALIGGLKSGLFGLVAGAAAVGLGLLELGRETANAGMDAYKLSLRLGTTTDAAQELAYAATASGSSVESLTTAMFRMNRTVAAAKGGSKEAQKALSGLGIPLDELYKMKPDEQFEKLAGGLHDVKDESKKAEKEQAVFGRGVIDLIPLIEKGAEGIAQFREEAHEMGLVLSQETIAESREFKREMRIAGEQVEALKFRIGALVLHGVLKLVKAWSEFKRVHADTLLNIARTAVLALTAATVAYGLINAGVMATAIGEWVALGAAAVVAGLEMAAAWAASVAPIAAVALGLITLYLWLNDIYHFIKGDKESLFGQWAKDIHSAKDAAKALLDILKQVLGITDYQDAVEKGEARIEAVNTNNKTFATQALRELRANIAAANLHAAGGGGPSLGSSLTPFADPSSAFSPGALAPTPSPGSGVVAPNFQANFQITQAPGQDPKELAGAVRTQIEDFHRTKMREAAAAVE